MASARRICSTAPIFAGSGERPIWQARQICPLMRSRPSAGTGRARKPSSLRRPFRHYWSTPNASPPGIWLGVHGRRKAGMGETFWQFRRYRARRSVHGRSTGASRPSRSTSLFANASGKQPKRLVLARCVCQHALCLAETFRKNGNARPCCRSRWHRLLVRGGERIGVLGAGAPPSSGRIALRRMAHRLVRAWRGRMPICRRICHVKRQCEMVWMSDFLQPLDAIEVRTEAAHL